MAANVQAPQFRTHPDFVGITHGLFESFTSNESHTDGPDAALRFLVRHQDSDSYYIREAEIDRAGVALQQQNAAALAIELFKTNTLAFPASWRAFDRLASAFADSNENELAIKNYRKSVELNPRNESAVRRIRELSKDK